jgi:hypothetical protein
MVGVLYRKRLAICVEYALKERKSGARDLLVIAR